MQLFHSSMQPGVHNSGNLLARSSVCGVVRDTRNVNVVPKTCEGLPNSNIVASFAVPQPSSTAFCGNVRECYIGRGLPAGVFTSIARTIHQPDINIPKTSCLGGKIASAAKSCCRFIRNEHELCGFNRIPDKTRTLNATSKENVSLRRLE